MPRPTATSIAWASSPRSSGSGCTSRSRTGRSDGSPLGPWLDKVRILNRYFNERLSTPNKKILILPDYFGLHREFNHGQIMADFELTAMEVEA